MKYVTFLENNVKHVVLCADHTSHSSISVGRATPISAGFFTIESGAVIVYGSSSSLRLSPSEEDPILIQSLLSNFGIYAFLSL